MNDDANDTKGAPAASRRPKLPHIDVFETGALVDGIQQRMNRRVFFQLWVFDVPAAGDVTEAARAWLRTGFENLGLDEIVSFAVHDNVRSTSVMERIGMRRDTARDFDHPAIPETCPQLKRHVFYALGRDEWRAATAGH